MWCNTRKLWPRQYVIVFFVCILFINASSVRAKNWSVSILLHLRVANLKVYIDQNMLNVEPWPGFYNNSETQLSLKYFSEKIRQILCISFFQSVYKEKDLLPVNTLDINKLKNNSLCRKHILFPLGASQWRPCCL